MLDAEKYFGAIDGARIGRLKELSELKRIFSTAIASDPLSIGSKAVIVLTYASWEGFYNDCVTTYINLLENAGLRITEVGWIMLIGALSPDFNALNDKNHSVEGRRQFVEKLESKLNCKFDSFDRSVVLAKSNLNFNRLRECLSLLRLDHSPLLGSRIRLDKELVGWRHEVAHGNPPDLSTMDVSDHVKFASEVMLLVADLFQGAVLKIISQSNPE